MIMGVLLLALIVIVIIAVRCVGGDDSGDTNSSGIVESTLDDGSDNNSAAEDTAESEETGGEAGVGVDIVSQAKAKAAQYDYDGAIELLQSSGNPEKDSTVSALISEYENQRNNLVATSPYNVTHIFFHSLVVDPSRTFSITDNATWNKGTVGFCKWMTTVDEFNATIQQMYDRGYVLVSIYDLVEETVDENGTVHMTSKNIYLPEGKKPFVLSLDDLSYYHSYDGRGTASRMIVGDDGKPTCEYVNADGVTQQGSYDCVPLLDDFIEQHPDFSYKGAKGIIALTGYNGILGYRTDYCYRDRVDLTSDQSAWLNAHPDYNWEQECAAAKEVADCLREDGWLFASHTWGHIRVGDSSLSRIQTDTEKWLGYVKPLIGDCDIIIFAHGQDLSSWETEYSSTDKFQYLKSQGFNIFCNVDGAQYFVQIGDTYLRMGRRNIDGYRLWRAVYGGDDLLSDLIDASTVFDPARPTDASLYSG